VSGSATDGASMIGIFSVNPAGEARRHRPFGVFPLETDVLGGDWESAWALEARAFDVECFAAAEIGPSGLRSPLSAPICLAPEVE